MRHTAHCRHDSCQYAVASTEYRYRSRIARPHPLHSRALSAGGGGQGTVDSDSEVDEEDDSDEVEQDEEEGVMRCEEEWVGEHEAEAHEETVLTDTSRGVMPGGGCDAGPYCPWLGW